MKTAIEHILKFVASWDMDMISRLGLISYIHQFRTIDIGLPRGCGKTSFLADFNKKHSSLLLTMPYIGYSGTAYRDIDTIYRDIRGTKIRGLKYNYLLIDEGTKININELLSFLVLHGLISEEFIILKLGTKY